MPRVGHFEITAEDPDRLAKFYADVFGWTSKKWDGPIDYWMISTGPQDEPGIDGGMSRREESANTVNTITVPSVDEYVEKIEQGGGTILRSKMPIPGVGWIAYFKDPDGNTFGIFEDDSSAA